MTPLTSDLHHLALFFGFPFFHLSVSFHISQSSDDLSHHTAPFRSAPHRRTAPLNEAGEEHTYVRVRCRSTCRFENIQFTIWFLRDNGTAIPLMSKFYFISVEH